MRLFFAGAEQKEYIEVLRNAHARNILQSYFYLGKKAPIDWVEMLLIDSGGYTARKHNKPIDVKLYAEYLNTHNPILAFNLDTNDLQETLDNQAYLCSVVKNTKIIPIYHASDWMNGDEYLLDQFVKEFDYIALGGTAGMPITETQQIEFYKSVFRVTQNRVKVHGLGCTARRLLMRFPFYSVDSTHWQNMGRYGESIAEKDKLFVKYKSRNIHRSINALDEIAAWQRVEAEMTKLWKGRGFVWKD